MSELIQLVYISQATFADDKQSSVRPEVSRILLQSRKNNPAVDVVGALYYKNGYFFQVLEGARENVENLYNKIIKDPRHKNSKILINKTIERSGFNDWSMKYGITDDDVNELLNKYGMIFFNPYKFTDEITENMVRLLQDVPLLDKSIENIEISKDKSEFTSPTFIISIVALITSLIAIFLAI
ncbi:MAG: BLUF domain-containing protein [Halothiobacillaceae bacterium]